MNELQNYLFDEMNRKRMEALRLIALAADGLASIERARDAEALANLAARKFFASMDAKPLGVSFPYVVPDEAGK